MSSCVPSSDRTPALVTTSLFPARYATCAMDDFENASTKLLFVLIRGYLEFAHHFPGHYEAGMYLPVAINS